MHEKPSAAETLNKAKGLLADLFFVSPDDIVPMEKTPFYAVSVPRSYDLELVADELKQHCPHLELKIGNLKSGAKTIPTLSLRRDSLCNADTVAELAAIDPVTFGGKVHVNRKISVHIPRITDFSVLADPRPDMHGVYVDSVTPAKPQKIRE